MKDFLKNIKLNENNIGFGLGVAVMVLTGILLVNYFKTLNKAGDANSQTLSTSTDQPAVGTPAAPMPTSSADGTLRIEGNQPKLGDQITTLAIEGGDYKIAKGDSLWKIAEKQYGDGFAWKKIYDANKSVIGDNPSVLVEGTTLALPKAEQPAVASTPTTGESKIYTVVKGDNLWKIAVAQCDGNGYAWSAIARENKLTNPGVIYADTKLTFTCPAKPAAAAAKTQLSTPTSSVSPTSTPALVR